MTSLVWVIVLTTLAGAAMPLGAFAGKIEHFQPRWLEEEFRHGVIAFGGGILLAAVCFALVPEGLVRIANWAALAWFFAGGVSFMLLDVVLAKFDTPASQLTAMLADFAPEAIALGAALAIGDSLGPLLAMLIALQNLPEGFNAYRELLAAGKLGSNRIVLFMTLLVPVGPLCGVLGYMFLYDQPAIVGALMLFAGGGILYLIFEDIAPQAVLKQKWLPPLGAVVGFSFGMGCHMLAG
ncbi:divalent cation transporter [Oceanidesulfovibrio indonesiensis]|jgi:ZIP family zinc transporter|uniref:Divalent cation transporter n=1 Tax=Oceanidesulfovibrio indonesiensis TaxID=54767 RepID=A0A7M3MGD9_9BACT|nr:divalent cation transporter [Oceanidesulfovibrio indonesiensis]TVM18384.1 divalent cation transporter [Oceanidesulfovibrio indonesiensis]